MVQSADDMVVVRPARLHSSGAVEEIGGRMRSIVDSFGCTLPVDGLSEILPGCPFCLGTGYICEDHPDRAWGDLEPEGCRCGAPGMPCWEGRRLLGVLDGPETPSDLPFVAGSLVGRCEES